MPILDSVTALIVSVWILKVGFQIFMQTNRDLMDANTEPELYQKVFNAVDRVEGTHNPHRLRIRKIGNYFMIVFDLEIEEFLTIRQSHEICMEVEKSIRKDINNVFDIMIHLEPLGFHHKEKLYGVSPEDLKGH
jgi:divalent metal cation (Fe/Co/Zn/Cd) transporter